MEPIINPWIIYIVSFLDKVNFLAFLMAFLLGIGMAISCMMYLIEDIEEAHKFLNKCKWPFIMSLAAIIVIPDRNTMLTMLAAQYITPDNIQVVQGNIVDFVGQIAQAVKDVK